MGIDPSQVSACLVTRGNVDMKPILDSLIFDNVIVWDNSERDDAAAYGRFLAAHEAPTEVCYFQDDDVLVPAATQHRLCQEYVDGRLLSNMEAFRHEQEWAWWGWGSIVQRELPELAHEHWGGDRHDQAFTHTGCDIIAGALIPHTLVDLPHQHLDYAFAADRLYRDPAYQDVWRPTMIDTALALRSMPLKLNLGCGDRRLPGFVNLDPSTGWHYEDGLPYADGTVQAITVSHSLMFVPVVDWTSVFTEFARVLEPGGVIRVTEDSTVDPASERYGGHPDAVALTTPALVTGHLRQAGLTVPKGAPRDRSLVQDFHGGPPKTFAVEGVK